MSIFGSKSRYCLASDRYWHHVSSYFDCRLPAHCEIWRYPQTFTRTSYHDSPYGNDTNTISLHKRYYRTRLPTARMHTGVMHGYTFMLETGTKAVLFKAWHGLAFHAFPYSEKVTLWYWRADALRGYTQQPPTDNTGNTIYDVEMYSTCWHTKTATVGLIP